MGGDSSKIFRLKRRWDKQLMRKLGFKGRNLRFMRQHFFMVMDCAFWYHLHNSKQVKNTHGGVLFLVMLQTKVCTFTKSNIPPWVYFKFFKLCKWYQIAQSISHYFQFVTLLIIRGLTISNLIPHKSYFAMGNELHDKGNGVRNLFNPRCRVLLFIFPLDKTLSILVHRLYPHSIMVWICIFIYLLYILIFVIYISDLS